MVVFSLLLCFSLLWLNWFSGSSVSPDKRQVEDMGERAMGSCSVSLRSIGSGFCAGRVAMHWDENAGSSGHIQSLDSHDQANPKMFVEKSRIIKAKLKKKEKKRIHVVLSSFTNTKDNLPSASFRCIVHSCLMQFTAWLGWSLLFLRSLSACWHFCSVLWASFHCRHLPDVSQLILY